METAMTSTTTLTQEQAELLETLARHRYFLRYTVRDLTDEQAARRVVPASELCLGGLIKHLTEGEQSWVDFILHGPAAKGGSEGYDEAAWISNFSMQPGETLAGVLEAYEQVARRTEEIVAALPDLNASQPLPVAPWFEPGASWSARRVLLHLIAETAQHAGHADILRESLDGAKTMG
jgi:hypothetical protein